MSFRASRYGCIDARLYLFIAVFLFSATLQAFKSNETTMMEEIREPKGCRRQPNE